MIDSVRVVAGSVSADCQSRRHRRRNRWYHSSGTGSHEESDDSLSWKFQILVIVKARSIIIRKQINK